MIDDLPDPDDIDDADDARDAYAKLLAEVQRLDNLTVRALENSREAVETADDLEDHVSMVDASVPEQSKSKLENVQSVLEYAVTDATGGPAGVTMETGEVTAAIDGSRDTALRLMDEIGGTFSWADVENPGGPNPKKLRLQVAGRERNDLLADVADQYGTA